MEKQLWLKRVPKKPVLVALLVIGILLILIGTFSSQKKTEKTAGDFSVKYYTETLEDRIADLCKSVDGVSDVHVLLTLDTGSEFVYAQNGEVASSGASISDYLIVEQNGDENVVLVKEIYPAVRGVAIVCRGGEYATIRQTLSELLGAALGIPQAKIKIAGAG